MITVVKFIKNPDPESQNSIISKTLGKYGVIINRGEGLAPDQLPSHGDFWQVEISKELVTRHESGNTGGCFILKPLRKITTDPRGKPDIAYLVPGGYKVIQFETSLIIVPQKLGFNWLVGLNLRHHLRDSHLADGKYRINAFVVSVDGDTSWPVEKLNREKSSGASKSPKPTIYSQYDR